MFNIGDIKTAAIYGASRSILTKAIFTGVVGVGMATGAKRAAEKDPSATLGGALTGSIDGIFMGVSAAAVGSVLGGRAITAKLVTTMTWRTIAILEGIRLAEEVIISQI